MIHGLTERIQEQQLALDSLKADFETKIDDLENGLDDARDLIGQSKEGIIVEVSDLIDQFFTKVSLKHDGLEA